MKRMVGGAIYLVLKMGVYRVMSISRGMFKNIYYNIYVYTINVL